MANVQPWAACLLTRMLIQYLEARQRDVASRLDYRDIVYAAEGVQLIPNPRAFLLDPNNWVPASVLRELARRCEEATGEKDFTYLAALAYYEAAQSRHYTLLETIAILLSDAEAVLHSAGHWASGYTNYLQLQTFTRPEEPRVQYMLSRYKPPVDPLFGNARLVQGNIEGIAKLDPQVDAISCVEQYSQVRLSTLVGEFGETYVVASKPTRVTVTCRATGEVVVIAKPITLSSEWLPLPDSSPQASSMDHDQMVVCPDTNGGLSLLLPYGETAISRAPDAQTAAPVTALRIERGGTLSTGKLGLTLQEGAIYDAPYTRYRIQLHKRESTTPQRAVPKSKESAMKEKQAVALLLFEHLKNLQATQRRTLSMVIRNVELTQENIQLKEELSAQEETGGLIGKSKAMQDVLTLIRTIAASDTTVLITGETGCGKELAARLIHQLSPRRDRRFLAVNCGALVESLLESELFGHERGAFTGATSQTKGKFELAGGGTLFLDEIGDVSQAVQVKLLRVLQEKTFQRVGGTVDLKADVRLVAATNRDLETMMDQNLFRRDLYYRLNVIQVYMPPLRERTEDIPELAGHFIERFAQRAGKPLKGLTPEALNLCLAYKWPGNIRELENVMERAVTLASGTSAWIIPERLPPTLRDTMTTMPSVELTDLVNRIEWPALLQTLRRTGSLTSLLSQLEWTITHRAIVEYGGNKSRAARALGRTYRWLRKLEASQTESEPPS